MAETLQTRLADPRRRSRIFATVVVVTAVLIAACSGNAPTGEVWSGDSTDWLGAAVWIVQGDVVEQQTVTHGVRNLDVVVTDVMLERDVYYWVERFDLPKISTGTTLPLELTLPSTRVDLEGQSLIFAVQAAGTPQELEAGTRHDGSRSFAVQLVFDTDWVLIDAGGDHFETYQDVLARYPGAGLPKVQALLDDARVGNQFDNECALLIDTFEDPEQAPDCHEDRPSTPGPLGEWRRDNGYESGRSGPIASLFGVVALKAVEDSGFRIPAEIYVREALYGDVMAIQSEGDPQLLSQDDKNALRSKLGFEANVEFFTDPSAVVDADWKLLPDRLVVLIGPIEDEETGQVVRVGVLAGSEPDDYYEGWYPVNPDTGEVGESPHITMVP